MLNRTIVGGTLCCGWRMQTPDMESRCEYIESSHSQPVAGGPPGCDD